MRCWIRKLGVPLAMLCSCTAQAAITCGMSVTDVYPIYNEAANAHADAAGSVTLTCARSAGEASTTYWIGRDLSSGSTLQRQTGTQTLAYSLFRNANYTGNWAMTNVTGISGTLSFSGPTASVTKSYYLRVPKTNGGQPAGLYDGTIALTQRFSFNGPDQSTATLRPVASIVAECRVSLAPVPLVLNYTSFSASAVTASTSFATSCTSGTPYTMSLDPIDGVLLGLNYSLTLSAGGATGNALPQTHFVLGTMASHQTGTCAMATCTGTQSHTITISY